jgi:hypothetical protein
VPRSTTKRTHIIEVGYSSDINMQDKEVFKAQQHAELTRLLEKPGLNNTVKTHTIILGRTAAIPTSLAEMLGGTVAQLTSEHIKRVETKLNIHAAQYVQHLYRARRAAEKDGQQAAATGNNEQPPHRHQKETKHPPHKHQNAPGAGHHPRPP